MDVGLLDALRLNGGDEPGVDSPGPAGRARLARRDPLPRGYAAHEASVLAEGAEDVSQTHRGGIIDRMDGEAKAGHSQ